jgi:hypothetical protein
LAPIVVPNHLTLRVKMLAGTKASHAKAHILKTGRAVVILIVISDRFYTIGGTQNPDQADASNTRQSGLKAAGDSFEEEYSEPNVKFVY